MAVPPPFRGGLRRAVRGDLGARGARRPSAARVRWRPSFARGGGVSTVQWRWPGSRRGIRQGMQAQKMLPDPERPRGQVVAAFGRRVPTARQPRGASAIATRNQDDSPRRLKLGPGGSTAWRSRERLPACVRPSTAVLRRAGRAPAALGLRSAARLASAATARSRACPPTRRRTHGAAGEAARDSRRAAARRASQERRGVRRARRCAARASRHRRRW